MFIDLWTFSFLQDKNAGKRHAPITFQADDDAKRQKKNAGGSKNASSSPTSSSEQRLYKTPSGKFSGKVSNYSNNSKSRNGNRNGNNYNRNQGKNKSFRKYWAPALYSIIIAHKQHTLNDKRNKQKDNNVCA